MLDEEYELKVNNRQFRSKLLDWTPFSSLLGHIRLILLVDWDPIGVFGIPEAMGQYDDYALGVLGLLSNGSNEADIVEHLKQIEVNAMCIVGDRLQRQLVAQKLKKVFEASDEKSNLPQ